MKTFTGIVQQRKNDQLVWLPKGARFADDVEAVRITRVGPSWLVEPVPLSELKKVRARNGSPESKTSRVVRPKRRAGTSTAPEKP